MLGVALAFLFSPHIGARLGKRVHLFAIVVSCVAAESVVFLQEFFSLFARARRECGDESTSSATTAPRNALAASFRCVLQHAGSGVRYRVYGQDLQPEEVTNLQTEEQLSLPHGAPQPPQQEVLLGESRPPLEPNTPPATRTASLRAFLAAHLGREFFSSAAKNPRSRRGIKVRVGAGKYDVHDLDREAGDSEEGGVAVASIFRIEFEPQGNVIALTPRHLTLPLVIVPGFNLFGGSRANGTRAQPFVPFYLNRDAPSCSSALLGSGGGREKSESERPSMREKCRKASPGRPPYQLWGGGAVFNDFESYLERAVSATEKCWDRDAFELGAWAQGMRLLDLLAEVVEVQEMAGRSLRISGGSGSPASLGPVELELELDAQGLDAALVYSLRDSSTILDRLTSIAVECQKSPPFLYRPARGYAAALENDCGKIQNFLVEEHGFALANEQLNNCACDEWNLKFGRKSANESRRASSFH